jgi:DNA-binding MarR family transcriptional regulator
MGIVQIPPPPQTLDMRRALREASVLLRRVLDRTAEFEHTVGESLGINRRDLEAMQHLLADGPLSPSDIARRLRVTTAAATILVDRLAAAGHVSRAAHPTDRRQVLVIPHPDSIAAAMGRILPLIMEVDEVLDEFSTAEQVVITRYLRRVVELYDEHIAAPTTPPEPEKPAKPGRKTSP